MHYMNYGPGYGSGMFGIGLPLVGSLVIVALLWSLLWKGLALWRAAKRGDTWWFIAFLVLNTLGILEIFYLFVIAGAKLSDFTKPTTHDHSHSH
jgi:hypothetical protein